MVIGFLLIICQNACSYFHLLIFLIILGRGQPFGPSSPYLPSEHSNVPFLHLFSSLPILLYAHQLPPDTSPQMCSYHLAFGIKCDGRETRTCSRNSVVTRATWKLYPVSQAKIKPWSLELSSSNTSCSSMYHPCFTYRL